MLKSNSKKDILIHLLTIGGITLVLIILFFSVYLPITTNHGEAIKVPDIKGKTLEQAEKILDDQNLRYEVNDSNYVAGAVPLSILMQHPLPGAEVKAKRKIYVTVTSKNPPMIPMPELKERSFKSAIIDLKSYGLILADTNIVPGEFSGLVIEQYLDGKPITAKTLIPKGSKITLDIASGKAAVEPEVIPETENEEVEPEN